jgi:ATP-dependent helicase HepA
MCFRFDFVVEARLDKAEAVMLDVFGGKGTAARAVLGRRGDALLAPFIVHIWLDEEGDEVPADFVEEHLAPKYAKAGGAGYVDKNLGPEHYRALKRLAPEAFGNWHDRCLRMHERARTLVLARPDLAERKKAALEHARAEDVVRHAQWRSRIQSLDGPELQAETVQFQLEQWLNDALYEGIADPCLKTDVAGVTFLCDRPVSVLDALMGSGE